MAIRCPKCGGAMRWEQDTYTIDWVCINGHLWHEARPAEPDIDRRTTPAGRRWTDARAAS